MIDLSPFLYIHCPPTAPLCTTTATTRCGSRWRKQQAAGSSRVVAECVDKAKNRSLVQFGACRDSESAQSVISSGHLQKTDERRQDNKCITKARNEEMLSVHHGFGFALIERITLDTRLPLALRNGCLLQQTSCVSKPVHLAPQQPLLID